MSTVEKSRTSRTIEQATVRKSSLPDVFKRFYQTNGDSDTTGKVADDVMKYVKKDYPKYLEDIKSKGSINSEKEKQIKTRCALNAISEVLKNEQKKADEGLLGKAKNTLFKKKDTAKLAVYEAEATNVITAEERAFLLESLQ